ncbi:putative Trafficking protein particle complex subunit 3 [Blattamonas nauphoetae]|uniref:Trafficking protein particle complex subunit 3 n=1 Tax=Blattamonas nauphoetae TaxID=2049346 RepID=A0ABQ9XCK4_9EUKA|nr:putative Trafficking protein particle complex subunit 3 [Blattamonas nauphoetae]
MTIDEVANLNETWTKTDVFFYWGSDAQVNTIPLVFEGGGMFLRSLTLEPIAFHVDHVEDSEAAPYIQGKKQHGTIDTIAFHISHNLSATPFFSLSDVSTFNIISCSFSCISVTKSTRTATLIHCISSHLTLTSTSVTIFDFNIEATTEQGALVHYALNDEFEETLEFHIIDCVMENITLSSPHTHLIYVQLVETSVFTVNSEKPTFKNIKFATELENSTCIFLACTDTTIVEDLKYNVDLTKCTYNVDHTYVSGPYQLIISTQNIVALPTDHIFVADLKSDYFSRQGCSDFNLSKLQPLLCYYSAPITPSIHLDIAGDDAFQQCNAKCPFSSLSHALTLGLTSYEFTIDNSFPISSPFSLTVPTQFKGTGSFAVDPEQTGLKLFSSQTTLSFSYLAFLVKSPLETVMIEGLPGSSVLFDQAYLVVSCQNPLFNLITSNGGTVKFTNFTLNNPTSSFHSLLINITNPHSVIFSASTFKNISCLDGTLVHIAGNESQPVCTFEGCTFSSIQPTKNQNREAGFVSDDDICRFLTSALTLENLNVTVRTSSFSDCQVPLAFSKCIASISSTNVSSSQLSSNFPDARHTLQCNESHITFSSFNPDEPVLLNWVLSKDCTLNGDFDHKDHFNVPVIYGHEIETVENTTTLHLIGKSFLPCGQQYTLMRRFGSVITNTTLDTPTSINSTDLSLSFNASLLLENGESYFVMSYSFAKMELDPFSVAEYYHVPFNFFDIFLFLILVIAMICLVVGSMNSLVLLISSSSMSSSSKLSSIAEDHWKRDKKVNMEFFSLTYGALVTEIVRDFEEPEDINAELFRIGRFIGSRLVDEIFAKTQIPACTTPRETADVIAYLGFRMFLGINVQPTFTFSDTTFSFVFKENPLTDFVELPDNMKSVVYCNILCGVIQGALECVSIDSACQYTKDPLRGDDTNEIMVELKGSLKSEQRS